MASATAREHGDMDDKQTTPDQTPDARTEPFTPESAPQHPTAAAAGSTGAPQAKPGRKRAWLIGGGIAAAVVLLGGGAAIGAAIADDLGEDDDRTSVSDSTGRDDDDADDQNEAQGGQGEGQEGQGDDRGPATGIGIASADELIAIADAARGAADGDVTSIDAKRDGTWEVQLTTADGADTDVRVDADLAASVIETEPADGDDFAPGLILDDTAIRALVDAALAEADGTITDLDVDSDNVSPYDASVLTTDNRSIDIDFDAQFAVVGTDLDD